MYSCQPGDMQRRASTAALQTSLVVTGATKKRPERRLVVNCLAEGQSFRIELSRHIKKSHRVP